MQDEIKRLTEMYNENIACWNRCGEMIEKGIDSTFFRRQQILIEKENISLINRLENICDEIIENKKVCQD